MTIREGLSLAGTIAVAVLQDLRWQVKDWQHRRQYPDEGPEPYEELATRADRLESARYRRDPSP